MGSKNKKVVVIGIDGLPYSIIRELIDRDVMPRFGRMAQDGALMQMKSSLPEVSSVAWTTFMTGKNPGEHDIYGFMELNSDYGYRFPNFTDIKAPTFWEKLGLVSIILNLPETYPAVRPLNGILVSGFVAIDLRKAVYPAKIYRRLKQMDYRLDVRAKLASEDPAAFFEDLFIVFEKRIEAMKYFFEREPWQIFIGTITATDRLHHYFFPQVLENGPFHHKVIDFYRKLDSFLGDMWLRAKDRGALFLTCSDHGFAPIETEVYLNRWLMKHGYLQLENGKEGLSGITERSLAFCLDPSRIYIHSEGRYPRGRVKAEEHGLLRKNIAEALYQLTYNGHRVVKKVYFREEIFSGPFSDRGPDMYVLPNYGFDLKGAVSRPDLFGRSHFNGMHTYDDAHLFAYPQRTMEKPRIDDIAGMIERHLNEKMIEDGF